MTLVSTYCLFDPRFLTTLGNQGIFAPGYVVNGTTEGDVDIYGHDSYPLGFDCASPYSKSYVSIEN
jgi:hypothetical protein